MPRDTLVVHVNKLRLNRDWAQSDDGIVMAASAPELVVLTKDNDRSIRWHLDLAKQTGISAGGGKASEEFRCVIAPDAGVRGLGTRTGQCAASGDGLRHLRR